MVSVRSQVDTTFDFRSDTPPGQDADSHSPRLFEYHQFLWSKPLPSGVVFKLEDARPKAYLRHQSKDREFWMSSDAVVPTFTRESKMAPILEGVPKKDLDFFDSIGYTMGGMMIFPGIRIGRKMTINGARGFHPRIKDRFDLTVECIRLHYLGESSPLEEVLNRDAEYFQLFQDFRGYVEFFLLQDIVADDFVSVKFFAQFGGFETSPLPSTTEAYIAYMQLAVEFIQARNRRISESF